MNLVKLLGEIGKSLKDAQELGRKFDTMNRVKQEKKRGGATAFRADLDDADGDEGVQLLG